MMIQVTRFYQDIRGHKVYPGVYNLTSPKLQGLGEQLVNDGFAVVLEADDDDELEVTVIDPNTEPETIEHVNIEFTHHAQSLMDEYGITESDVLSFLGRPEDDKFLKSDIEAYIEAHTD